MRDAPTGLTPTQQYLTAYHDANAGVTARAFGGPPVPRGALPFAPTCHSPISPMPTGNGSLTVLYPTRGDGRTLSLIRDACAPGQITLIGVAALDSCIRQYPSAPKHHGLAGLCFGDRCVRSEDGIREMLTPSFDHIQIDDMRMPRRHTPQQLRDWRLGTYDTDLLTSEGGEGSRQSDLQAPHSLCGPRGDLRFDERHLQFSARAAR